MIIATKVLTRRKLAGTVSETIDIPIPPRASAMNWSVCQIGSQPSIVNTLNSRVILVDGLVTFTGQSGTTVLYTGTGTALVHGRSFDVNGTHIRWVIQANVLATNEFYLKLTFLDT